jgi:hypothetical protein
MKNVVSVVSAPMHSFQIPNNSILCLLRQSSLPVPSISTDLENKKGYALV